MSQRFIRAHDARKLAAAIAERLQTRLSELLEASQQPVHLALTGGTIGIACLAEFARLQTLTAQQWSRVHLWWGDERYVEADSPDRNDLQATTALLHSLPIPASNLHRFPGSESGMTLDEAASSFERQATGWFGAPAGEGVPGSKSFDLLLLGMGPDGHIASLFPGRGHETGRWIVAEADSPKPPSRRLSFSLQGLLAASEIWLLVSGSEKAPVLASALSEGVEGNPGLPVARLLGHPNLLLLVDEAASPAG